MPDESEPTQVAASPTSPQRTRNFSNNPREREIERVQAPRTLRSLHQHRLLAEISGDAISPL